MENKKHAIVATGALDSADIGGPTCSAGLAALLRWTRNRAAMAQQHAADARRSNIGFSAGFMTEEWRAHANAYEATAKEIERLIRLADQAVDDAIRADEKMLAYLQAERG